MSAAEQEEVSYAVGKYIHTAYTYAWKIVFLIGERCRARNWLR